MYQRDIGVFDTHEMAVGREILVSKVYTDVSKETVLDIIERFNGNFEGKFETHSKP